MQISKPNLKGAVRHFGPLFISLCGLWLLQDYLPNVDIAAITALFQEFALSSWLLAAAFTALSLTAVGFYDVTAVRMMRLPITTSAAFSAGWRATAIAQTLGFGLVTGSLVRWRLLNLQGREGLWNGTKLTTLVTASFFYGWLVVAGLAASMSPSLPDQIRWLGFLALWAAFTAAIFALRASPRHQTPFPPIPFLTRVSGLTFIDTIAACAVIYCFLPDSYTSFSMFYISFLIAFSIGMLSGVPGGVGPFEVCLLALLAPADPTPLFAALLAYRAIYFVVPAALAGVSLIRTPKTTKQPKPVASQQAHPDWPAEASLVDQGTLQKMIGADGYGIAAKTLNSEIYLRSPNGSNPAAFLVNRRTAARRDGRRLVLYKCTEAIAKQAKTAGLWSVPIASEAILIPARFTTDGKTFSQLRRKLRKAQNAGVTFENGPALFYQMQRIDREWQARAGRARGFSVGQFSADLANRQAVFSAYRNGKLIAYISCHISKDRWVLDLMRSADGCPDGTMQGLVIAALNCAKKNSVSEFSLCSVPFYTPHARLGFATWILGKIYASSDSAHGLWRFKSSFVPDWRTEHYAFDGMWGLLLGTYDICQLITDPLPLPADTATQPIHDDYDNYEFASISER